MCEHIRRQAGELSSNNNNTIVANPSVPIWPMALVKRAKMNDILLKKNQVIQFANSINYTFPYTCLTAAEQDAIWKKTYMDEQSMVPDFFHPNKLKQDFKRALQKHKFCSVDVAQVLQDTQWSDFFQRNRRKALL